MTHSRELDWLESSVGAWLRSDRTVISVSGDDAHEWLQGQITNQCEGAKPGESVYGFVLTLKGRVMADVWALFHHEGIWLDVPESQVDALLQRLDHYIIMEDVDLEHRADLRIFVAQGPKSDGLAEGDWPADHLGTGGREWIVEQSKVDEELERVSARARALGGGWINAEAWASAHVVRGRPRFGVDFGDWTYPQETGLTPIAVSFNKGCYVGQETVVMLQNRGKAPKVLWRWTLHGSEVPAPKSEIRREGEAVGELTSAARFGERVEALGFLKRGHEAEAQGFEIEGRAARPIGPVSEAPGLGTLPT
jgi:folate-binding protein YgfZ